MKSSNGVTILTTRDIEALPIGTMDLWFWLWARSGPIEISISDLAMRVGLGRNKVRSMVQQLSSANIIRVVTRQGKIHSYSAKPITIIDKTPRSRAIAFLPNLSGVLNAVDRPLCSRCCELAIQAISRGWPINTGLQQNRIDELQAMSYQDYLASPEWQRCRVWKLCEAGNRCQVCNAGQADLDVHHRTYERRGCEHPEDLLVLCWTCHKIFHENGRLR